MWMYYFALVAALWLFFNTFFRSPWLVWRRGLPVVAALPLFCTAFCPRLGGDE